ncbi:MAG: hypothetical protein K6E48_03735 [Lachnospiraceae bacterium]|nr:hypothetical protein [Lachnospiraceae bacterium]
MKKRLVCIALALCVASTLFAGCGTKKEKETFSSQVKKRLIEVGLETEEVTEEATAEEP